MPEHTEPTWLSPAAAQKLQDEYDRLTTTGRIEIAERIAEARSHGDIRENADYDAAKNEQGLMEARIRKLRHLLDTAEIREVDDTDHVTVGCMVTVRDEDGDEMEFFVANQENKVRGMLLASPSSPLGGALMGAAVGDTVGYEAPGGTFSYEILAIRPYEG
ncbi:MAG: transcription elongation factor GreA [Actinobacteria bacterium]|nr:transcription elongation factor GreA [Actinomycetota bacterium]